MQLLCINCNYSKRISNKETKDRPRLSEVELFNVPLMKDDDDEYNDKMSRDMEVFINRHRQFKPIFLRKLREIMFLQEKKRQALERKSKYKV